MLTLTVDGVDQSDFTIYSVSISAGRDDVYSQPDAATLDLEFIAWEPAGNVGQVVILTDSVEGQLFRGWITDVKATLQDDMSWRTSVVAVGALALLGQSYAGGPEFPVETDSQRIKRIVDETSLASMLAIDVNVTGYNLAGRLGATEPDNAATMARMAADSGLGVLWEDPTSYDQPLRYTPWKYRSWDEYSPAWGELDDSTWDEQPATMTWEQFDSGNIPILNRPPAYELDPATVYADLVFEQNVNDYALTVSVSWGAEDAEVSPDAVKVGSGKPPEKTFSTILELQTDAMSYAQTKLDVLQTPAWRLTSATVDVLLLTTAQRLQLREALQVGARITVVMPHGSPVGARWEGYLEGWDEHISQDNNSREHILDLHISDRFLTESADRWYEIDSAVTWDAIDDTIRWTDTTQIPDSMQEA